jgi:hypothetical protein
MHATTTALAPLAQLQVGQWATPAVVQTTCRAKALAATRGQRKFYEKAHTAHSAALVVATVGELLCQPWT